MNDDKLIKDNIPLVYHIINKYYPTYTKDEDIIQAGMLGLVKASKNYSNQKSKFSTYAGVCIRNEIVNELRYRQKHSAVSLDKLIESGWDF